MRSALVLTVACNSGGRVVPLAASVNPSWTLDSLRCGQVDDERHCVLYNASLYELITRPAAFHGKRVRVIGFAHFEFEGNGLYAHRVDWEQSLFQNGVWLEPPRVDLDSLNDRYLLVEGRFDAKDRGHMGLWSGSIDSVTRYYIWELSPAPRDSSGRPARSRR
jgi:hypothetical protein